MTFEILSAPTIGHAYRLLVMACWRRGAVVDTEYGEKSRDLSPGGAYIYTPLQEPLISRAAFAWYKKDAYTREILVGEEDHRIGKDWWYTYHQRLFSWPWANSQVADVLYGSKNPHFSASEGSSLADLFPSACGSVDQVAFIVDKLVRVPYSRRAQGITWNPLIDETVDSSPCLQRIWFRVVDGALHLHTYWRSRDLWKAWWLNAYGMMRLQLFVATALGQRGLKVEPGPMFDVSSSLHIYERDWKDAEAAVKIMDERPIHEQFAWPKEES